MRWLNRRPEKRKKSRKSRTGRKRPMPRWARTAARAGVAATVFALAFGGPTWLWQSGWVASAVGSLYRGAAEALADNGLRVEEIFLQGRTHESTARIRGALGIERGQPLLTVDLETARQRLERLPWIRAASVEREFPNAIRVRIAERRPLALWQHRNRLMLVDDEGAVITDRNLQRFRHLLVIVGNDAPAHATGLLNILDHEPGLRRRVNAAVRIGDRRWNIRMDNGVFVRLPETGALAAWSRFARLERQHKLLKKDLLSIDLRIPDQLIVRTRGMGPARPRDADDRKGKNT